MQFISTGYSKTPQHVLVRHKLDMDIAKNPSACVMLSKIFKNDHVVFPFHVSVSASPPMYAITLQIDYNMLLDHHNEQCSNIILTNHYFT